MKLENIENDLIEYLNVPSQIDANVEILSQSGNSINKIVQKLAKRYYHEFEDNTDEKTKYNLTFLALYNSLDKLSNYASTNDKDKRYITHPDNLKKRIKKFKSKIKKKSEVKKKLNNTHSYEIIKYVLELVEPIKDSFTEYDDSLKHLYFNLFFKKIIELEKNKNWNNVKNA